MGPPQVITCGVVSRPVPGGGSRLSLEKARTQRVAGGGPPPPLFYGPPVPTRSFWRLLSRIRSRGYFLRDSKTDLERIFRKKYAEKAFYERKSPNQGTYMGTVIAPPPGQCGTNAKTSERQQAGHKNRGSRGLAPGPLSPHFSGEMGTPAGQAGPRGAAPRGTVRAPTTRRVRSTLPRPRPGPGGNPRGRC